MLFETILTSGNFNEIQTQFNEKESCTNIHQMAVYKTRFSLQTD